MSRNHKSTYLFIPLLAAFALGRNAFATAPAAAPKSAPGTAADPTLKIENAAPAPAGKKSCEDIKSEIEAKLKAKDYRLTLMARKEFCEMIRKVRTAV